MSAFLSKSACHGHRPNHLVGRHHHPRPDLIARMLRERQVARFLVAPEGFGKSGLAMEYCNTVFSFEHVFWINGRSPCFLRDLDLNIIDSTVMHIDDRVCLVVFEDVPLLNTLRVEALSLTFDTLLAAGCEVLVTCTPLGDAFAAAQHDRLRLSAVDLLLNNAELDSSRSIEERAARPSPSFTAIERVAGLHWGGAGCKAQFAASIMREELPADLLLPLATMLILEKGLLCDLEMFGSCDQESIAFLAVNYPYLGIDQHAEHFDAVGLSLKTLAEVLREKLDIIAQCSYFSNRDSLVQHWASVLVSRECGEQACELMGALCSRESRGEWLAERSHELLKNSCVLPAHQLYASIEAASARKNDRLEIGEAVRRFVLGDDMGANKRAKRLAFEVNAPQEVRAIASLFVIRWGKRATRERALQQLEHLLCEADEEILEVEQGKTKREIGKGAREPQNDRDIWRSLARFQLALASGTLEEAEKIVLHEKETPEDARILVAAWVFSELAERAVPGRTNASFEQTSFVGRLEEFIRGRLQNITSNSYDYFTSAAGLALERARERGVCATQDPLGGAESLAIHRVEMDIFSQRRAFDQGIRQRDLRRAAHAPINPNAYGNVGFLSNSNRNADMVPILTVNLFGGMEIIIGDETVNMGNVRREKIKTLLALLVLNRGKDFPRDGLVSVLWPGSSLAGARKNFYTLWSHLRRLLADQSGMCPYLIRDRGGCKIDDRLLKTDVARFETVCRTLLFDQPSNDGWAQLYAEINLAFLDDLLPLEQDNEYIVRVREEYRVQLVDALVSAAERLVASGDAQEGLWFARAALRRDRSREDAYLALMRAQISAGQRTAAMDTYFACRRFLSTELGLDPSMQTVALYRSVIETEEYV